MTDPRAGAPVDLLLPSERIERWVENFEGRHGATSLALHDGELTGSAEDGSTFAMRLPFGRSYAGAADAPEFVAATAPPDDWGVLLVRKGGFAIARLHGERVEAHKVGQRHVQGRTKAGGQSQQRFARRRDNQARSAYEAAATHAGRLLAGVPWLVTGGDREALRATLAAAHLTADIDPRVLDVAEPRRRTVLDGAIADACCAHVTVTNA